MKGVIVSGHVSIQYIAGATLFSVAACMSSRYAMMAGRHEKKRTDPLTVALRYGAYLAPSSLYGGAHLLKSSVLMNPSTHR